MTKDKLTPTEGVSAPDVAEPSPARAPTQPGSPQDTSSLRAAWRRGLTPDPIERGSQPPHPPVG